ncbi:MAG: YceI family protein [Geminicoccaceae bacterium]|nr:YceI family protein [Geminicoccaceae bacterium]
MKRMPVLAAAAALTLAGAAHAADTYRFDPNGHHDILFSYDHLGQSRTFGRFGAYEGTFTIDAGNPQASRFEVTIEAASIDTGIEALDAHLRSADFFAVDTHPTITFVSTAVEPTGEKTARVTGDLTIKENTRPVTLEVTLNYLGRHKLADFAPQYDVEVAGFSARGIVSRSDFDVAMAAPMVSDEVELIIEAELFRDEG